jgi:hypothetical membrane protein
VNTQQVFQALQNSEIGISMGQSNNLFGVLAQLFHILGLVFVLASIFLVNLRLLGYGLVNQTPAQLVRATNPYVWTGLLFLALSGVFMFVPSAALYYPNPAFWFKFKVMIGALIIQFTLYQYVTSQKSPHRLVAIITAITSIILWLLVGFAGRAIGFMAA